MGKPNRPALHDVDAGSRLEVEHGVAQRTVEEKVEVLSAGIKAKLLGRIVEESLDVTDDNRDFFFIRKCQKHHRLARA